MPYEITKYGYLVLIALEVQGTGKSGLSGLAVKVPVWNVRDVGLNPTW